MQTNQTYSGNVEVQVGSTTFNYKNTGQKDLGIAITKALAGYPIDDYVPTLFDIQEKVDETWRSVLNNPSPFVGKVYDTNSNDLGKLTLNTTIQFGNKRYRESTNDNMRLCMYSNSYKLLAIAGDTVTHDNGTEQTMNVKDMYNKITAGVTAFLKWEMIFNNEVITPEA